MIKKISKIFLLGVILYFIFLIELSNLYAFPFLLIFVFLINFLEDHHQKQVFIQHFLLDYFGIFILLIILD